MLADDGPWEHHVKVTGSEAYVEIVDWLSSQGLRKGKDWQFIKDDTGFSKHSLRISYNAKRIPVILKWIFFFNDPKLATYVKLTWGKK
jgi:hypothetical protein